MNKNKLILSVSVILGCIILGIFYQAENLKKENANNEIIKMFDNKEKCAKYREGIIKSVNEYNFSNIDKADRGIIMTQDFNEIFYSKSLNTCLARITQNYSNQELYIAKTDYIIIDLLSSSEVYRKSVDKIKNSYSDYDFTLEIEKFR